MACLRDQLFPCRMGVHILPTVFLAVFSQLFQISQAREFCQVEGYWCETGHCCGSGECCTYYYELWWFWLVWFLIVFIIGFCVWQRKRFHPWRDNRCERSCSIQDMFLGRGFNFSDITPVPPCKLPSYSEIGETVSYDTPPPPYNVEAALPACLGEGPSTSLPVGEGHCPPPHRSLQAITQSVSSLNSTPSPSDAPPSYAQIIGNCTPVFSSMPSTQILSSQQRPSMGTQFPEQGLTQNVQQQQQQQQNLQEPQNQNNSGSNTALNSPSTPGRPVSTSVTHVAGVVNTCACGSPLRSPVVTPHARMLPPSVPSSPKTTVVSMAQRPQRFLSPHGSPHRFTTSLVNASQSSSCSNLSRQSISEAGHSLNATLPSRPGAAVRTLADDSQGDDPSNGHTVVDMRTSRRGLGFFSRWHLR